MFVEESSGSRSFEHLSRASVASILEQLEQVELLSGRGVRSASAYGSTFPFGPHCGRVLGSPLSEKKTVVTRFNSKRPVYLNP